MPKKTKGICTTGKVQEYEKAVLHCKYQFIDNNHHDVQMAEISVTISFPFNLQSIASDIGQ